MHAFLKSSGKNYLKRRLGMDIALQNFLVRYKELDRNLVLKWTGKLKVIKKKQIKKPTQQEQQQQNQAGI